MLPHRNTGASRYLLVQLHLCQWPEIWHLFKTGGESSRGTAATQAAGVFDEWRADLIGKTAKDGTRRAKLSLCAKAFIRREAGGRANSLFGRLNEFLA